MEVVVTTKVQGEAEYSSVGVSLTLTPANLGLEEPVSPEEVSSVFKKAFELSNFLIGTHFYRMGLMNKNLAEQRRKFYSESVVSEKKKGVE